LRGSRLRKIPSTPRTRINQDTDREIADIDVNQTVRRFQSTPTRWCYGFSQNRFQAPTQAFDAHMPFEPKQHLDTFQPLKVWATLGGMGRTRHSKVAT